MTEVKLFVAVELVDAAVAFFSGVAFALTVETAIGPVGLR